MHSLENGIEEYLSRHPADTVNWLLLNEFQAVEKATAAEQQNQKTKHLYPP